MSGWIAGLDAFAAAWSGAMWRASWQAGIAIAAAWALCRLLRGLPATLRCWIWRAAYAKLLLALIWAGAVELPLLPRAQDASRAGQTMRRSGSDNGHVLEAQPPLMVLENRYRRPPGLHDRSAPRTAVGRDLAPRGHPPPGNGAAKACESPGRGGGCPLGARSRPTADRLLARSSMPLHAAIQRSPGPSPAACLVLLWLSGLAWGLIRLVRAATRLRRLARSWVPASDPALLDNVRRISERLGLRSLPAVRLTDESAGPMVAGWMRPVLALPAALLGELSPEERRLILAHELAHLRRRDLAWGWLPLLARLLFFFHPLVWLAEAHWRLAQEIACDELALRATRAPARPYGELLLKIAARQGRAPLRPFGVAACRVVESLWTLERRLTVIHSHARVPRRRWLLSLAATTALVVPALIPWRVVAQTSDSSMALPTPVSPVSPAAPGTSTTPAPAALPVPPPAAGVPVAPPGPATTPVLPPPASGAPAALPPGGAPVAPAPATAPAALPPGTPPVAPLPATGPVAPPSGTLPITPPPATGPAALPPSTAPPAPRALPRAATPRPGPLPGAAPSRVARRGPGDGGSAGARALDAQDVAAAQAQLEVMEANLAQARAQFDQSQANRVPAAANVDAAQAELKAAETDYKRLKTLYDQGSVSQGEVEKAEATVARARADVAQAEAQFKQGHNTVAAAEAQVRRAEAQLQQARAALDQTRDAARAAEARPDLPGERGAGAAAAVPPGLAAARLNAARQAYEQAMRAFHEGQKDDPETLYTWSRRVLDAQQDAAPGDRTAALEAHLKRMQELENLARERVKVGVATANSVAPVEFYRIEAQTWLEQARSGGAGAAPARAGALSGAATP